MYQQSYHQPPGQVTDQELCNALVDTLSHRSHDNPVIDYYHRIVSQYNYQNQKFAKLMESSKRFIDYMVAIKREPPHAVLGYAASTCVDVSAAFTAAGDVGFTQSIPVMFRQFIDDKIREGNHIDQDMDQMSHAQPQSHYGGHYNQPQSGYPQQAPYQHNQPYAAANRYNQPQAMGHPTTRYGGSTQQQASPQSLVGGKPTAFSRHSTPASSHGSAQHLAPNYTQSSLAKSIQSSQIKSPSYEVRPRPEPIEEPLQEGNAIMTQTTQRHIATKESEIMNYEDHKQTIIPQAGRLTSHVEREHQQMFWGDLNRESTFTVEGKTEKVPSALSLLQINEPYYACGVDHAATIALADIILEGEDDTEVNYYQPYSYCFNDVTLLDLVPDKETAALRIKESRFHEFVRPDTTIADMYVLLHDLDQKDDGALTFKMARQINKTLTRLINETLVYYFGLDTWDIDSFIDDWNDLVKALKAQDGLPKGASVKDFISGELSCHLVCRATPFRSLTVDDSESKLIDRLVPSTNKHLASRSIYCIEPVSVLQMRDESCLLDLHLEQSQGYITEVSHPDLFSLVKTHIDSFQSSDVYSKHLLRMSDGTIFELNYTLLVDEADNEMISIRMQ